MFHVAGHTLIRVPEQQDQLCLLGFNVNPLLLEIDDPMGFIDLLRSMGFSKETGLV